MRLYLSSYRIGNYTNELLNLLGSGRKVAIIENALDHLKQEVRNKYKDSYDINAVFKNLGFQVQTINLRDYFNSNKDIELELKKFNLVWACGGNAFLLRRAMLQSGFDIAIRKLLSEDKLVYGGWSAGICVLGKTLKGLELCDNPKSTAEGYNSEIIWDGVGVINFSIAPHFKSNHPESSMIEKVVEFFEKEKMDYLPLCDGEVIIYNGETKTLLK